MVSAGYQKVLSRLIGVRSLGGWRSVITEARKRGDRYFLIQKKVDYATLKKLKELPDFQGRASSRADLLPSLKTEGSFRTMNLQPGL